MTKPRRPKIVTRAERIRAAILDDLHGRGPLPLSEMTNARRVAVTHQEVYITAERMVATGILRRHGRGYHQGDPHRYEALVNPRGKA